MGIQKTNKLIALITILFFCFSVNIFADSGSNYNFDFVQSKEIKFKQKNIDVSGHIPVISKFKNNTFEKQINQKIDSLIKQQLDVFDTQDIKSVSIGYKTKAGKNLISILIYFRLPDKTAYLETVNFNIKTFVFPSIKDILGVNSPQIINQLIKEQTINSPEKYNINFLGIDGDYKKFYLDGDYVNIFFDPYELAPAIKNIESFKIKTSSIENKFVSKKDYYSAKPYDTKMLAIRDICERFGFEISFNQANNFIQINKNDLSVLAFVNKNFYVKNKETPKTLENSIAIKNGKSYAPISFFKEYLELFYTIDEDENIIFSSYTR